MIDAKKLTEIVYYYSCLHCGCNYSNERSNRREETDARAITAKIVKERINGITLAELGLLLGYKTKSSHCMAIHCLRKCNNLLENNKEFREKFYKVLTDVDLSTILLDERRVRNDYEDDHDKIWN